MTTTTHRTYHGGLVQSLSFDCPEGSRVRAGVGVFQPREESYAFGVAEREEHVTVLQGAIELNGRAYAVGEQMIIPAGTNLNFRVVGQPAIYHATYYGA